MKIVQINAVCGIGSTGRICTGISGLLSRSGIENVILVPYSANRYSRGRTYSTWAAVKIQATRSRLLGNYGFNSPRMTERLIGQLEQMEPDLVHLHNHNCHLEMLFYWLREQEIPIVWTFHDCWAFTGYCPHFLLYQCGKWQPGCRNCPQYHSFSLLSDRSEELWARKMAAFAGQNMVIAAPSQWMKEQAEQSFLREYPVRLIPNGVNLSVFQPAGSDFRKQYSCEDQFLLLSAASGWNGRKGLDVLMDLAGRLDNRFRIILVGTDEQVEREFPRRIIPIRRTQNRRLLAQLYTAADLFVNPTREDTYPTVHMEALACGTPVLTFRTGGSAEMLDETCGCGLSREILMPWSGKFAVSKRSVPFPGRCALPGQRDLTPR